MRPPSGLPSAISTLTALTQLDLSYNKLAGGWQHLLQLIPLQDLKLSFCSLTALPQQVSALRSLPAWACLGACSWLAAGSWQRMLALTQLQGHSLGQCSLMAVPEQLPELTALTRLDLRADAYGCSKEARL